MLLLNLQLFAANALGCVHQPDHAAAVVDCPHTNGAAAAEGAITAAPLASGSGGVDSVSGDACQKCNLGKVAGAWHLVLAPSPLLLSRPALLPVSHPVAGAPHYTPDGLLRPPRPLSG
ncbi:hypothetical protein [Thiohalocapsa halophila]|uniref:hypothetical protein n=1 Tax=Thiohalocapsa halophila TaxID=69359 RepID=UPI001908880B|nr:hypothetical protein [Thiohalocapsa halophila]